MSDSDERERIREQKRKELIEEHSDETVGGDEGTGTPTEPVEIESQAHFEELTSEHELVLVDCYADWCGPCKMMEPTIESLAAETDALVVKVDVDAHQGLAQQLGARSIPTLLVFSDGEPVERVVGAQDRSTLEGLLQQAS
ncbi:thioredoxin [Halobacteriaceae archaeon SHR40]|uniref:thioredoxin n=1 Tax=Halovenus amylolytica TaxID=2500550 RepID=UPI000FE37092